MRTHHAQFEKGDLITEAAYLSAHVDYIQAQGKTPSAEVVHRLNEIQQMAKARLTPEQQQAALQHFEQQKLKIIEDAGHIQNKNQQVLDNAKTSQQLAHHIGMMGVELPVDAMADILRGKRTVTIPAKRGLDMGQLEETVKTQTRFKSLKGYEAALDRLGNKYMSDPQAATAEAEKLGIDKQTIRDWGFGGKSLEFEMQKRESARLKNAKDETYTLSPENERHIGVVKAFYEKNPDDLDLSEAERFVKNNADDLQRNDRYGDLYRAVAEDAFKQEHAFASEALENEYYSDTEETENE
jgi:hypothetical protein